MAHTMLFLTLIKKSTLILHDEFLKMDNLWAMEFFEAPTLESKGKDSTNEHGSFILETPQNPCFSDTSPESVTLSVMCIYENHKHFLVLASKTFRRMVVDSFACCKYCRFRGCTVVLILQLEYQWNNHRMVVKVGTTLPRIAAMR